MNISWPSLLPPHSREHKGGLQVLVGSAGWDKHDQAAVCPASCFLISISRTLLFLPQPLSLCKSAASFYPNSFDLSYPESQRLIAGVLTDIEGWISFSPQKMRFLTVWQVDRPRSHPGRNKNMTSGFSITVRTTNFFFPPENFPGSLKVSKPCPLAS